jgi:glycosyltransferase involved in cell wall biosynthesis
VIIGIDACNIRQGGGVTHLSHLLKESNPQKHGFSKIVVWSNKKTLSYLPDFDWIDKRSNKYLEKNFLFSFYFQTFLFSQELKNNFCNIVFVPGGTFLSDFKPFVTISQNMLPFELNEAFRYKSILKKLKFLLLRMTQSFTFKTANGLIFLSEYARSNISLKVNITNNFDIIPHGINYEFTHKPKLQKSISEYSYDKPFKLLYVSILSPYKHQNNLVKVVCELYNSGIPVKLTLIGPSESESLFELKKALELYDCSKFCVEYKGAVKHENLFLEYKSADGFIFASTCENLPIILIEAMSSGLPIICSKFGPMQEVLGENNGMYFNPLDLKDTQNKLRDFLLDEKLRNKISFDSFSRSLTFTWSEMADKTFSFLTKINLKYYDK